MKRTCIVVEDDLTVTQREISDEEIPAMLDSGFFTAVLRLYGGMIEYADVDWKAYTVNWRSPVIKE